MQLKTSSEEIEKNAMEKGERSEKWKLQILRRSCLT